MTAESAPGASSEIIEVDLRNPILAAVLAWLFPGLGHLYQRRYAKGILFLVCIAGTFSFGVAISEGRAVYASFTPTERRWQFVCQAGVGTPAILALVQRHRVIANGQPPLLDGFLAPPHPVNPNGQDELAEWHRQYHVYFDLSTLYTMIAGLLNALVVYDAFAGPMATPVEDTERGPPKRKEDEPPNKTG